MREHEGLVVELVNRNENAEKAGIKEGDLLLTYNDKPLKVYADLVAAVGDSAGETGPVSVRVVRGDQELVLSADTGSLGVSVKDKVKKTSASLPEAKPVKTVSDSVKAPKSGTGYISWLNFIAVSTLVLGVLLSALIFTFFGYVEVRYGIKQMDPVGVFVSLVVLVQSIITFILLKVVAIMALEVKAIKEKLLG